MDVIPILLLILRHLLCGQMIRSELVVLLLDAEDNDAASGVAEGGVCFPETARKASERTFEFNLGVFALIAKAADI